jgi:ribonucleoside-diphosphate reductase alpha chain
MTTVAEQSVLGTDILQSEQYSVERRDGSLVKFNQGKIERAILAAFKAEEGFAEPSERVRGEVLSILEKVLVSLQDRRPMGGTFHIEEIQDQVEISLMREGSPEIAKRFVIYRESRAKARETIEPTVQDKDLAKGLTMTNSEGVEVPLDMTLLQRLVQEACEGFEAIVDRDDLLKETVANLYKGVPERQISKSLVMVARSRIEEDPAWSVVTARILMDEIRCEVLGEEISQKQMEDTYPTYFESYIQQGVQEGLLDKELEHFDLRKLGEAIVPERDTEINYLGLQTLYDRYFVHLEDGQRIELLQAFWMRVAMGLALNEIEREKYAIQFYNMLSTFRFVSSTPTLFNSGTPHSQMSSCYLSTFQDDLQGIFKGVQDDAMLSKFAGGLGNDWTNVRAMGAHIKGTNGKSQGVIPFLKVANDTAVAVNQGGRRKGAMCAYLETWHLDIEEFLELRKNTGDDRRRTHDMNTANWIPDLFMKRVQDGGEWTLFSPNDVPDLHDAYGKDFEERYARYEEMTRTGQMKLYKRIAAVDLWRKMLGMLYETGHPWITFKDPSNIRSPQRHKGTVHSSNLCTEILLNTSKEEVAVCNLGSINLAVHVNEDGLLEEKLQETISVGMRMLDNVIDLNYYPIAEARTSNVRHRPVGMGLMGFQDALYIQNISYTSPQAIEFSDSSMEAISYHAIMASSLLAKERGRYPSYEGSAWSKGLLPIDTLKELQEQRGQEIQIDEKTTKNWDSVRNHVAQWGMRNSNCMAIAPTATISNIAGVTQSIEPTYKNLYVKSNLSGEFTVVNSHLVNKLKALNLWDKDMVHDLKYFDGELAEIERIPQSIKDVFTTAFDIEPKWLVQCAAKRQKWIDMGQSLNLYMQEPSGPKLDAMYRLAWETGLKTTYYLRSLGATGMEKNTAKRTSAPKPQAQPVATEAPAACSILDPDCEACQ